MKHITTKISLLLVNLTPDHLRMIKLLLALALFLLGVGAPESGGESGE